MCQMSFMDQESCSPPEGEKIGTESEEVGAQLEEGKGDCALPSGHASRMG